MKGTTSLRASEKDRSVICPESLPHALQPQQIIGQTLLFFGLHRKTSENSLRGFANDLTVPGK